MKLAQVIDDINANSSRSEHAAAWLRPEDGIEEATRSLVLQLAEYVQHRLPDQGLPGLIQLHGMTAALQHHLGDEPRHGRLDSLELQRSVWQIRSAICEAIEGKPPQC